MQPLVNFYDGEPWFDNPRGNPLLTIANPKRRKKTMRRNRRRRGRKNAPRRRARRNYYSAGMLANRPKRRRRTRRARSNVYMPMVNSRRRRRRSRSNPRRRSFRRNPSLMGFTLPPMDAVLFTAAGFIGPNLVSNQILAVIPASWKTNTDGTPNQLTIWATKVAAVAIPAYALRRFVNPRAGTLFLIGAAAGLALDAIKTFAPSLATTLHLNGVGSQPLLGSYFTRPQGALANFPRQARVPAMIGDSPDRLNPQGRF